MADRWKQIDALLDAALDLPAAEQEAFLTTACAGDTDLRQEVLSLLTKQDKVAGFLERPAMGTVAQAMATTLADPRAEAAPNVLARDFSASKPNERWVTDITYVQTADGWCYLAAILDLFSRRVVGWATSANNDRALALDALRAALIARRPPPGGPG